MKKLLALLLIPTFLHAGAGSFAAIAAAVAISNHHGIGGVDVGLSAVLANHREKILHAAAQDARDIPGATEVEIIRSLVSLGSCKFAPYYVIRVKNKKNDSLAFMLWGLDTTAGSKIWRLIIFEQKLEDFNEYVRNTPFFDAVIVNPYKAERWYC